MRSKPEDKKLKEMLQQQMAIQQAQLDALQKLQEQNNGSYKG